MDRSRRDALRLILLAVIPAAVAGCAKGNGSSAAGPPAVLTRTPVSDFRAVAGKWSGVLLREPASDEEDWVQLMIEEDGTFVGQVVRPIGVLVEKGTFSLRDGTLTWTTGDGTLLVTLFAGGGKKALKLDARSAAGLRYRADLIPAR